MPASGREAIGGGVAFLAVRQTDWRPLFMGEDRVGVLTAPAFAVEVVVDKTRHLPPHAQVLAHGHAYRAVIEHMSASMATWWLVELW